MKVFRVEHKSKKLNANRYGGPYGISGLVSTSDWVEEAHYSLPTPQSDIPNIPAFFDDYICGFKSLSQLQSWFTPLEIKNLKQLGFVIVQYKTKKTLKGSRQVLFVPEGLRTIIKT